MPTSHIEISSSEDIITPQRAAKGDLKISYNAKGFINNANPVDRFLIRELIRLRILEPHHEIYGVGFLELRSAFRSPWAPKSSAILLEQWGIGVSVSRASEIYQEICREMTWKGLDIVDFVMEMDLLNRNRGDIQRIVAIYEPGAYQEHFERLVFLMDDIRQRNSQ